MSLKETIIRQRLIIQKLRRRSASLKEIVAYLEQESELQGYNFTISARTFQRDIQDIASLYNIEITFNFSQKVYFISNEEEPENERMLEAFDTFNALNLSDRISNNIQFEKRKPIGTQYFHGLLHAIQNCLQIQFTYQKYWDNTPSLRKAEAYTLKEYRNRWYILVKDLKDGQLKIFALDRILSLEITKQTFIFPQELNSQDYFKHAFGVIFPEEDIVEEVIISFTPFQGKYIKSLPLHESQEILVDNETELRIRLRMYVTYDFIMELLSMGNELTVIQPQHLIESITNTAKAILQKYVK